MRSTIPTILACAAALLGAAAIPLLQIHPEVETQPVAHDVDDPAIWPNPRDPAASLIVGTIKRPRPDGGLAVYDLDGKLLEVVGNLNRPNNVDILGELCVATERLERRLVVYRVHEQKPHLRFIGAVPVFQGQAGERGAPMGIALYQRRSDKALFAIVSRKQGPARGYLWQYRLYADGHLVRAEKVREFGAFSGRSEIEAVAVDPERELVYYADEDCCVRVYRADPDAPDAAQEVGRLATSPFKGNREGIAIAGRWIIVTEQLDPQSNYHVFDRTSWRPIAIWHGVSSATDGIEALAVPLGPRFPTGILVAMNNAARNFHLYRLPQQ